MIDNPGEVGEAVRLTPASVNRTIGARSEELAHTLESLSGAEDRRTAEQVSHIYEYYLPILKEHYDDYPSAFETSIICIRLPKDIRKSRPFYRTWPWNRQAVRSMSSLPDRDDERMVFIDHSLGQRVGMAMCLRHLGGGWKIPCIYSFVTDEELEEERRLFYVAVTRAKRHLFDVPH